MTEFNVILRKIQYAEMIVNAKNEKDAKELAMDIYESGNANWGEVEVEVLEVEEI